MKAIINRINSRIQAAQNACSGVNNDTLNGRIVGLELARHLVEASRFVKLEHIALEIESRASKIKGDDNFNAMRRCALIEVADLLNERISE